MRARLEGRVDYLVGNWPKVEKMVSTHKRVSQAM